MLGLETQPVMPRFAKSKISLPRGKPAHVRSFPNDGCIPPLSSRPLPVGCTIETTYAQMLREEEEMDLMFNIAVSAANWALLAGYLVVPGTFTSLQSSDKMERALQANKAGRTVLRTIQNPPLLSIACCLLLGGIAAFLWLLHFPKLRGNYIWLINKLFV
jgi:hypothetical protein